MGLLDRTLEQILQLYLWLRFLHFYFVPVLQQAILTDHILK